MDMRVLVVEDDAHTVLYLKQGLTEHGFVPDVAETAEAGKRLAREHDYDMAVLDVMLPGGDGWSVLKDMRSAGKETPVIFLTARDGVEDRVRGLEMGADDYLVKPFAFSELLARMRTVMRRSAPRQPDVLKVGDLELDWVRHRASRGGKRLTLRPKEFALLSLLTRRAGEVLSRTFIAEQVWDMNFDSDSNVVDVQVRRLRMAVDEGFDKKLIHTVVGVGYVLEDRVA
jgi:two-component system copper resistance phosphate regulon response regulator CusR